jgi:membrane protease subunit HflK
MATAEGDAARFKQVYVEYAKAPAVTRDRMYIDSMREMYNNVTKVLVDTTKSNSMLYLPLDKIIAQVNSESTQVATGQSPASTPTGSVTVGGATGNPAAPFSNSSSSSNFNSGAANPNNSADKRDGGLRSRDREAR